jgi:capsular polysaccharide biosynthesis protein
MSEQTFNQIPEDAISLKDIIDFLIESWKSIALGVIVGGLLGAGYAWTKHPIYQAIGSIQVAKVAGSDVENPALLVEKLKMPMYYSEKSYLACDVMKISEPGDRIAKALKPALSKTASIINISYTSKSSEDSRACLEAILGDINANQKLLSKPIIDIKKNQLSTIKRKLETAQKNIKIIPIKDNYFDFSDSKMIASSLLIALVMSKENEINDLQSKINDLEISLSEPQTMEANFIAPIFSPNSKVSPSVRLTLLLGLVIGFFGSLLFLIGKKTLKAYKENS